MLVFVSLPHFPFLINSHILARIVKRHVRTVTYSDYKAAQTLKLDTVCTRTEHTVASTAGFEALLQRSLLTWKHRNAVPPMPPGTEIRLTDF